MARSARFCGFRVFGVFCVPPCRRTMMRGCRPVAALTPYTPPEFRDEPKFGNGSPVGTEAPVVVAKSGHRPALARYQQLKRAPLGRASVRRNLNHGVNEGYVASLDGHHAGRSGWESNALERWDAGTPSHEVERDRGPGRDQESECDPRGLRRTVLEAPRPGSTAIAGRVDRPAVHRRANHTSTRRLQADCLGTLRRDDTECEVTLIADYRIGNDGGRWWHHRNAIRGDVRDRSSLTKPTNEPRRCESRVACRLRYISRRESTEPQPSARAISIDCVGDH